MNYKFSVRSLKFLDTVHPDLQTVIKLGLRRSPIDFGITEGVRTKARQQEMFNARLSKTLNSRHIHGYAVDVVAFVGGKITWEWKYYELIAAAIKEASKELGIPIEWGGDWANFRDGVHFQLPHGKYPNPKDATGGTLV